jgi:RNA polymerase sigma factor (sigma-70 family)
MRGQADEDNTEDGSAVRRWEAMRHVYIAHQPKLLRFVARRVGGHREAEDVCQEVWRVFYVNYDEYVASYGHAPKMLYPIARYRIGDFWKQKRGRAHEVAVEREDLVGLADVLCQGPDEHRRADRRVDLESALADLPPRQREALYLRYVDDLTEGQTATLMSVSVNTVKKYLKKAKEKLRTTVSLDSYGPEGEYE